MCWHRLLFVHIRTCFLYIAKGLSQILRGHAVVLIRCHPNCLVFMNSWGQKFADGGFFRVRDGTVLHDMEFLMCTGRKVICYQARKRLLRQAGLMSGKSF